MRADTAQRGIPPWKQGSSEAGEANCELGRSELHRQGAGEGRAPPDPGSRCSVGLSGCPCSDCVPAVTGTG